MSEATLEHASDDNRRDWRIAAAKSRRAAADLVQEWGIEFNPSYADNSRETIRDETFHKWLESGAVRRRSDKATSYPGPIWALEDDFADLFDPSLTQDEFDAAVETWRDRHLSPGAKLKAAFATYEKRDQSAVRVQLPGGITRTLEPGIASLILKGVIEGWAPLRLGKPVVVAISEPGEKLFAGDNDLLRFLGITINPSTLLPDAVLADLKPDPVVFWIIEAVNSDGPIDDARRAKLETWAAAQGIDPEHCRFLTAFRSRADAAARKRLKDLAAGTFAWFADEPTHELAWRDLAEDSEAAGLPGLGGDQDPHGVDVVEVAAATTQSDGIRTERITTATDDTNYLGGSGTSEYYEYRCPCGDGKIVEEHENIPGNREHYVRMDCGKCREEWVFVLDKGVRQWLIRRADSKP
ncbi:BsuBI/PstI family type II restriction endonuclease [Nocardioides alkalitolerans]|uniref:BsuBI/PstI family type II restriction endonuclease n=1 Tax=Nocardioides alkalitolerans TaxID=281714 RepID=UPI001B7FD5BD|nr:BsuBI/PstI family type II restriction endonuclease [Nocardioides alkalitolerans]